MCVGLLSAFSLTRLAGARILSFSPTADLRGAGRTTSGSSSDRCCDQEMIGYAPKRLQQTNPPAILFPPTSPADWDITTAPSAAGQRPALPSDAAEDIISPRDKVNH